MKQIRSFTAMVAVVAIAAAAHAQMTPNDEGDASYHHTVRVDGPGAAVPAGSGYYGGPSHDIPTIDQTAQGTARADVSFVTGGVGDEERAAIESSKGEYNLHVTNARTDGAFVGATQIVIHEKSGKQEQMLDVTAGPLLYVQLPDGTYVLDAVHGTEHKHQQFTIGTKGKKAATLTLGWKAPVAATEMPE